MAASKSPISDRVKIELPTDVLRQLINQGALCGADCKCLDSASKQVLWQSLLNSTFASKNA